MSDLTADPFSELYVHLLTVAASSAIIKRGFYKRGSEKVQRLSCSACRQRFSADPLLRESQLIPGLRSRYTDEVVWQVIDNYFHGRCSYRRVGRRGPERKIVGTKTAYKFVTHAAANCKTPIEVSIELRPEWGTLFLELDGTTVKLKCESRVLLTALETETQDIPHARVVLNEHTLGPIARFVQELRDTLSFRPIMIVIDDNPTLRSAVITTYPGVPIQLCVLHKQWQIDRLLSDGKIEDLESEDPELAKELRRLKRLIYSFLWTQSEDTALDCLSEIRTKKWAPRQQDQGKKKSKAEQMMQNANAAVRSILSDAEELLTHFRVDKQLEREGRLTKKAPRVTSVTDGFHSRFDLKRRQVRGFKSAKNLPAYMYMAIMEYRASDFEGAQDPRGPLERAKRAVGDWIAFSQRRKSKKETAIFT